MSTPSPPSKRATTARTWAYPPPTPPSWRLRRIRRGRGTAPRLFFFLLCELRVLCVLCVKSAPLNAPAKNARAPLSIPSPVLQTHACPARGSCAFPRAARSNRTSPPPSLRSPTRAAAPCGTRASAPSSGSNQKSCAAPPARESAHASSTKHERIRGLGALRKTFDYYLKKAPKLAYHMEQPHVSVNGGMAVATFYWSVQLGGRHKIHGRGTHVFAKQGKEWKVVHEHFSRAH